MPNGFFLLHHWNMVLAIRAVKLMAGRVAALAQKEFRQIQVFLVVRGAVQFYQAGFNHLMTGRRKPLTGAESAGNQIRVLQCDVQEISLARGLVVRESSLVQMSRIIQLVAGTQVVPARTWLYPPGRRGIRVKRPPGAQITVILLRGCDLDDNIIEVLFQFLIGMNLEGIRGAFDDFIHIGIIERHFTFVFPFHQPAGLGKIANPAFFFTFVKAKWNRNGAVGFDSAGPEIIRQADRGKRHGRNGIIAFGFLEFTRKRSGHEQQQDVLHGAHSAFRWLSD